MCVIDVKSLYMHVAIRKSHPPDETTKFTDKQFQTKLLTIKVTTTHKTILTNLLYSDEMPFA